jgi:hypothetical protein
MNKIIRDQDTEDDIHENVYRSFENEIINPTKRKRDKDSEENIPVKRFRSFEGEIINPGNPAFVKLLNELIEFDKFPKKINLTLKYYYAKMIKSFQLINKYDTKAFELESFQNNLKYELDSFINNFNEINKFIILLNNKLDLSKKKIKLFQNKLYCDINNVKELSKYLLSLNIDILNSIDDKEHLETIIEEHSKTNFNIMITNNNIQKDSAELRKLEDEHSKYLNDLQIYLLKFVDLKVEISSILNKYREHRLKTKEMHNLYCMIRESSVIQTFTKIHILKSFDNVNNLKEILQNESCNLYYFNHVNKNYGCKGCDSEKCKDMLKRMKHFKKCKDSKCIECNKTNKYCVLYNEYIKDE